MKIDFTGKRVLVTGASRGIGKQISDDLESLGAEVVKLDSRQYDLTSSEQLYLLADDLRNVVPRIDVCINNAGINIIDNLEDIKTDDYERIMRINTQAPFMIVQAIVDKMKENNYGRIVNISSIFGHCTKEKRMSYTTSKYALIGMTKTMAVELAPHNILANSVAPGFTETELTAKILGAKGIKEMSSMVPMKRMATPKEISKVVLFLASEENTYLTGQNIIVDGGFVNV